MDDHFYRNVRRKGGKYGRLADDFVISSRRREEAYEFGRELDHAIAKSNLKVNQRKRRQKGMLAGDKLKEIHSLVVNSRRGVRPKDDHIQKGLQLANHYARCCRCATPTDLPHLADLRSRAAGMMYYFRQAEFSPAKHLGRMLDAADRKILSMLAKNGLQPHKNKWWIVHKRRNEPQRLLTLWEQKESVPRPA
jgi:hypothetical protein